jgi:hypothetical protein
MVVITRACVLISFFCYSESTFINPSKWDYIGPFPIGKPEFDGDPIASYGGIQAIKRPSRNTYPSILANRNGNRVGWQVLKAAKEDNGISYVNIPPSHFVDWNRLVSSSGGTEILEFQGWAVSDLSIVKAGRYQVSCSHINTFYIGKKMKASSSGRNGTVKEEVLVPYVGDQYNVGCIKAATYLEAGKTSLYVHVRGKVQSKFTCRLEGPFQFTRGKSAPLMSQQVDMDGNVIVNHHQQQQQQQYHDDDVEKLPSLKLLTVWRPGWYPDLVGSALMGGYISLPVFNPNDFDVDLIDIVAEITNVPLPITSTQKGKEEKKHERELQAVFVDDRSSDQRFIRKVSSGQYAYLPVKLSLIYHTEEIGGAKEYSVFDTCKPVLFDLRLRVTKSKEDQRKSSDNKKEASSSSSFLSVSNLMLKCRKPTESFIYSFIDHDSTVSQAASIAPTDYVSHAMKKQRKKKKANTSKKHNKVEMEEKTSSSSSSTTMDDNGSITGRKKKEYNDVSLPIILSLHGTSISPSNQADSYKRKDNNNDPDYTFGVDGYVCVFVNIYIYTYILLLHWHIVVCFLSYLFLRCTFEWLIHTIHIFTIVFVCLLSKFLDMCPYSPRSA